MIYRQLYQKFGQKEKVCVGIIGTGAYGTAVVTQGLATPYLNITIVADILLENAKGAYKKAGIADSEQVYCRSAAEAEAAIRDGKYVYTDKSDIIAQVSSIDIICDSTGNPEIAAKNALRC